MLLACFRPANLIAYIPYIKIFKLFFQKIFLFVIYVIYLWPNQNTNTMTNERAKEILTDCQAWLSNAEPLHWNASEIGLAINFAAIEMGSILATEVLKDYRNWLEFGQPFYHRIDNLIDALSIAIETLNTNNQ